MVFYCSLGNELIFEEKEGEQEKTNLGSMLITYNQSRNRETIMNDHLGIFFGCLQ
jgi:hypothetical protein